MLVGQVNHKDICTVAQEDDINRSTFHHLIWELVTAEMLKGKRKSLCNNSSAVEEDQLKVTFLFVVFLHFVASFTGPVTGLSFVIEC
jgi:hypothetical protein